MLCFAHVNGNVVLATVFANNHTCVNWHAHAYKQTASFLRVEQAVSGGNAILKANKTTTAALLDVALVLVVAVKNATHNAKTFGVGQKFSAVTNQATRWNTELQSCGALVVRHHVQEFRLA